MVSCKTLVFGGGEIHDWKGIQPKVIDILSECDDMEVTVAQEDLSVLEDDNIEPYDVLVFHYTVGAITNVQRNGLSNWLASGKGYVGIHSAADSFHDDPDYRNLVGGYFITHPRYREYQVNVKDTEHPITQGLDDEFMVTDEQYILDYDSRVHVLASALWRGEAMPVAWTKSHGKGRVFYLALGHDVKACEHPAFQKLLRQGTQWAAANDEP